MMRYHAEMITVITPLAIRHYFDFSFAITLRCRHAATIFSPSFAITGY